MTVADADDYVISLGYLTDAVASFPGFGPLVFAARFPRGALIWDTVIASKPSRMTFSRKKFCGRTIAIA